MSDNRKIVTLGADLANQLMPVIKIVEADQCANSDDRLLLWSSFLSGLSGQMRASIGKDTSLEVATMLCEILEMAEPEINKMERDKRRENIGMAAVETEKKV